MHWRTRVLTGKYSHWCYEWDELPVDETCMEWPCGCKESLEESLEQPHALPIAPTIATSNTEEPQ